MVDIHLQGQKVENATTSDIQELVKMGVLPTPYRNGEPEALKLAQMIFQYMQQQELLRMQQHQQQHQPAQITGGYVGQPLLPQANPVPYEVPRNVIPRPLEVNPTVAPIPVHSVTAPPTSPPMPPPTRVEAPAAAPGVPPLFGGGAGTTTANPGKPQMATVKALASGRKRVGVVLVFLLAFFVPIGGVWWWLKGSAPAKDKVEAPTPAASPPPAPSPAANPAPAPAAQESPPAPTPPPPPVDAPTERLRQQIVIDKPIQP